MSANMQDIPDRREELLTHAIELVRHSGLAGLTMRKLAARVGFTETAAYRYFPNKRALILGLVEKLREMLLDPIREISDSTDRPESKVERILRYHIDFVLRLDGLPIMFLAEAAMTADEELLTSLRNTVGQYLAVLEDVVEDIGPFRGGVQSGDVALLLMGIPATLAIRRRLGSEPEVENRAQEVLLPFVLRCLAGGGEQ